MHTIYINNTLHTYSAYKCSGQKCMKSNHTCIVCKSPIHSMWSCEIFFLVLLTVMMYLLYHLNKWPSKENWETLSNLFFWLAPAEKHFITTEFKDFLFQVKQPVLLLKTCLPHSSIAVSLTENFFVAGQPPLGAFFTTNPYHA